MHSRRATRPHSRSRCSTWQDVGPQGRGGDTCSHAHTHVNASSDARTPRARPLPSAAQPPTSRTTRRPMGPTTEATPGPQAGAMLGSDLQPPTSALEGGWPPSPSKRGHKPSVSRGSVCRDNRGTGERGMGQPRGLSWRRQPVDHRGAEESPGMGEGYRTVGEGRRALMEQKNSLTTGCVCSPISLC